MIRERSVAEFNADIEINDGYLYSTSNKLSCTMANQRISEAIIDMASFGGKRVLDIGCGDGTYTVEIIKSGASEVLGIDGAENAIKCAERKANKQKKIRFQVADIYKLEKPEKRYDLAVVRGILHHLYEVIAAIEVISKVADEIIVLEPNGFNPVLKVLEKVSPYHIEHEEKSYAPTRLNRWFEKFGGKIIDSRYIGLVPMFCPDYLARALKKIEPVVEAFPVIRNVCCGQYLLKIKML